MIIVPGCGPVWPIRKPLKAFGFTVVVTRTEINQRSIGNSIILNHQRFMPNNNYSFDTFAKIFEVAYFYIIRSLIQDGESTSSPYWGALTPSSTKKNIKLGLRMALEWFLKWFVNRSSWFFVNHVFFCWEMNLFCRLEGEVWP